MATLGMVVAADLLNTTLNAYERGDALMQTNQDKPLLKLLRDNKKTFASGLPTISLGIQGTVMSDTAGFVQGYSEDDSLNFAQAQNVLRCTYPWKEIHMGLIITHTELKKDGISVTEGKKWSMHTKAELNQLVEIGKNRMEDYRESCERGENQMFWDTGAQDAKQVPGILSILTDTPGAGTTGGLSRVTYPWWNHIARVGSGKITPSKQDQTLSQQLRDDLIQLKRFGGMPTKALCGSGFIRALQTEVTAMGVYTQTGFDNKSATNIGVAAINIPGLGTFEYDPTLDSLGKAKHCYILDVRRLKQMPMADEDNKKFLPERPYNYMVWMCSKTWTGGLVCNQLNANEVIEVA